MNSSAPESSHATAFSRVPPGALYFIFFLCGFLLLVSTALVIYIFHQRRSFRHRHQQIPTSDQEDTQSEIKHYDDASSIPVTLERVSTLQVVTNTMSSRMSENPIEPASDHSEHSSSETQHLSFQSVLGSPQELEDRRSQCASPIPFLAPRALAKRSSCPKPRGIGDEASGRSFSLPLVRSGSEKLSRLETSRSNLRMAFSGLKAGSNGDQILPVMSPRLSFDSSKLEQTGINSSWKPQKRRFSQRSQQSPTPPIMSPAPEATREPTPPNPMPMSPVPTSSGWFDSSNSEEDDKQSSRSKWKKRIARRRGVYLRR